MVLLLNHWFGITPAITSPLIDILCYLFAFKYLGKHFLKRSAVSTLSLAGVFFLWDKIPVMLPDLSENPLMASVLGGIFVGVGVGLVVRQGVSTGGDDALALTISKVTGCRISFSYLFSDLAVLILSLTYIPFGRVVFSIITVMISSILIDFIREFSFNKSKETVSLCESIDDNA